jgi:hypothetical protein
MCRVPVHTRMLGMLGMRHTLSRRGSPCLIEAHPVFSPFAATLPWPRGTQVHMRHAPLEG